MHPVARNILAVVPGAVAASALVALIEAVGHTVYPVPGGLDFSKPEQILAYVQGLPVGALIFVLAGWVIGTFGGALLAAWISKTSPMLCAGIVGGLMLAATIANLLMIPPPAWFAIVGVVGVPLAAWAAGKLRQRKAAL